MIVHCVPRRFCASSYNRDMETIATATPTPRNEQCSRRAARTSVPTYKEVLAALGTLLAEYSEIDEMLDGFMDSALEVLPKERSQQRQSNRAFGRILRVYQRAINAQPHGALMPCPNDAQRGQ